MKIILTRDSICAADDMFAPHWKEISVKKEASLDNIFKEVIRIGYLLRLDQDTTWCAASEYPLAVLSHRWKKPKIFYILGMDKLDYDFSGRLKIHFTYYAGEDPDLVLRIIREFRNKGIEDKGI